MKYKEFVNSKVKVTNKLDKQTTGTLIDDSSKYGVIVLEVFGKDSNDRQNYKIINTAFVKSIEVLSLPRNEKKHSGDVTIKPTFISVVELKNEMKNASLDTNSRRKGNSKTGTQAKKLYQKFVSKMGSENVKWEGSSNIVLYDEIKLSHPYTLGKSGNITKINPNSKYFSKVEAILKEFWLENNNKKGG